MTMPMSTRTTRISMRVMPRTALREWNDCFIFMEYLLRDPLDAHLLYKFAHAHDAQQNGKHDASDHHRQAEDEHRLQDGQESLDRHLNLAIVDLGNAIEHFLEPSRLF